MQTDLFADGAADSIPPWQDPAHACEVCVYSETDRDHVGAQAIGRLGNNRTVRVVQVRDNNGHPLLHETYPADPFDMTADVRAAQIRRLIARNRQTRLFS